MAGMLSDMKKKTILLIEDDELVLKLLDINFQPHGYNVVKHLGGRGAFERALEEKPSLIILDLMMPRIDGWAVLEQLKGHEETRNIPVIVLSVKGSPEDQERARRQGVTHYVVKPFNPSELVYLVKSEIGDPGA
jgi:DNA-binding response OmpR family regulator